jgi:hypothetical protein
MVRARSGCVPRAPPAPPIITARLVAVVLMDDGAEPEGCADDDQLCSPSGSLTTGGREGWGRGERGEGGGQDLVLLRPFVWAYAK